MIYVKNSKEFVRLNYKEIANIVGSLCYKHRINSCSIDDIINDVILRIISRKILENVYSPGTAKVSTYIYAIAKNFILNFKRNNEYKLCNSYLNIDYHDFDNLFHYNDLNPEYQEIVNKNSEPPDGIKLDLNIFEDSFKNKKGKKKYPLKSHKNMKIRINGCTRYQIYYYLKQGYTGKEIAKIFGVSDMFVCIAKKDIQKIMQEYGFYSLNKKKTNRRKLKRIRVI